METKSISPGTIISGFFNLIVILLFIVVRLNVDDIQKLFSLLTSITVGATAILASIVFGASYVLGTLFHRIVADFSNLVKRNPELKITKEMNRDKINAFYNSWSAKSFFYSIAFSWSLIWIQILILDFRYRDGIDFWTIMIIGFAFEIFSILASITQRQDFIKKRDELKGQSK